MTKKLKQNSRRKRWDHIHRSCKYVNGLAGSGVGPGSTFTPLEIRFLLCLPSNRSTM